MGHKGILYWVSMQSSVFGCSETQLMVQLLRKLQVPLAAAPETELRALAEQAPSKRRASGACGYSSRRTRRG
jgi:hypothetical protein